MADSDEVRAARAALACLLPPGHPAAHAALAAHGPVAALRQLTAATPTSAEVLGTVEARQLATYADTALVTARRAGARIVIPEDDDWPPRLGDLATTPAGEADSAALCLWVRGDGNGQPLSTLLHRCVAVVGARAATVYGTHIANQLGYDLATAGVVTLGSGGFGVDAAAARGTLAGGGTAVVVLSCGVDRAHPAPHADLFGRIAERGALLSPWPPGTHPSRTRFAATARLLATLAAGTVLVEASGRSNALRVLRHAIVLGRVAMVVPGPVTSALSAGTHQALREHPQARLVRDATDVIADLNDTQSA